MVSTSGPKTDPLLLGEFGTRGSVFTHRRHMGPGAALGCCVGCNSASRCTGAGHVFQPCSFRDQVVRLDSCCARRLHGGPRSSLRRSAQSPSYAGRLCDPNDCPVHLPAPWSPGTDTSPRGGVNRCLVAARMRAMTRATPPASSRGRWPVVFQASPAQTSASRIAPPVRP